jgi:hypothetical protein
MNTIKLLAVAAIALIGCGDNQKIPDAAILPDATPAAPTLGAQIDRMGRGAVNTALNNVFNPDSATAGPKKDAYNQAAPAAWVMNVPEFMKNLAFIDVLDQSATAGSGCGNQPMFTAALGPQAYFPLAALLANDQLWVNTNRPVCTNYLAVEFALVMMNPSSSTCGGRKPDYDVIDFSLSMLAAGTAGFDVSGTGIFTGKIKDGVDAHTDLLTDFPYLGPPH